MKEYQTPDIRNIALVGHGSSGKTMLCEAMLVSSGIIGRLGNIANGSTVSDYHEEEQQRQISIHSSLLYTEWLGKKINIIDTPGYLDFISESLGALRVADSAVIVIHANQGIEVGTEHAWKIATENKIPKILVINALDKEHSNFDQILNQAKETFGNKVFPINIPLNVGPGFDQILDILNKEKLTYKTDGTGKFEKSAAEGDLADKAQSMHEELMEFVAESDDSLLEKFFEEGSLTEEEMLSGIHAALQNESIIPVFCVSSETNVGVNLLMDFIAKYGSSPNDKANEKAVDSDSNEVEISISDPDTVCYVFKTISGAHIGDLSFFRIFSGTLKTGMELHNSDKKVSERIGQIFLLNGKNRTSVKTLNSGDIGAVVKLKDTHTNNTLCNTKKSVSLPKVEYPQPNIHAALTPKAKGEEEKIAIGLSTLHEEDPTFIFRVDPELHQTVISGQGELHLQVISSRLKNRFNVDIILSKPKIPYRETIKGKAESKYRHKKQSGGAGQFAEVWMRVEPNAMGEGVDFKDTLVGQNVDRVFVPSVEKGVNAACEEGILAGYRVVDVKIDFYDGKQHPVDSKDIAFQIAGKHAFEQAFKEANPCFLEPILKIEVKIPDEFMGGAMGEISGRRGRILGMDSKDGFQIIKAHVPQSELYGFSTTIRSLSRGRGIHTEEFSHYEEIPRELEQKVIEESKNTEED